MSPYFALASCKNACRIASMPTIGIPQMAASTPRRSMVFRARLAPRYLRFGVSVCSWVVSKFFFTTRVDCVKCDLRSSDSGGDFFLPKVWVRMRLSRSKSRLQPRKSARFGRQYPTTRYSQLYERRARKNVRANLRREGVDHLLDQSL